MCDLCSDDKQEARNYAQGLGIEARQLENVALYLRGLASGRIQPHDPKELAKIRTTANAAIRLLVDHFVR